MPPPVPSSSAKNWYYTSQGQQAGPVTFLELRQRVVAHQLFYNDMVWREGMPQWLPAGQTQELGNLFIPMPGEDIGQNAGIRMLIPVGRSAWAIAAGYLGLFCLCILPAPVAVIISVVAINELRRDKSKHGMGRAVFGLVAGILGCIGGLVILISLVTKR